jgi:phosphoserine aminotransferase
MEIPENYKVLFLQGGASLQFVMVPMNLMRTNKKMDIVVSGSWSKKALKEAKRFGDAKVVADSSDKTFSYFPEFDGSMVRDDACYLHITTNNTIYGTTLFDLPEVGIPVVTDMSSSILSQPINVNDYGIIYAGAQKNIGPAGVCIVIIREDLISDDEDIPTMLSYKTHADAGSLFNTPPTYAIYMANPVFEYILSLGGVEEMEKINRKKSRLIYDAIDQSSLFKAHVEDEKCRSLMNIPFFAESDEINQKFVKEAAAEGMVTLKGHRSVGGMRASIYNAMPYEGCVKLANFIENFDKENR